MFSTLSHLLREQVLRQILAQVADAPADDAAGPDAPRSRSSRSWCGSRPSRRGLRFGVRQLAVEPGAVGFDVGEHFRDHLRHQGLEVFGIELQIKAGA